VTGDGVLKKVHPGQVIKSLQQAVETLHKADKLNKQLQSQFASGSASWHMCEEIDDKLHEVFTLLGE